MTYFESDFRQHSIDKIFKLDPKTPPSTNRNRIYLIPSCLISLKHVLDQISGLTNFGASENFSIIIIVIPKILSVFETLLEEEGLSGIVTLKAFQWELMYADEGVLTLELPFIYKSMFVNKDNSLIGSISNSLWTFFHIVGQPKMFIAIGKQSSSILELYDTYYNSFDKTHIKNDSDFSTLLVVDRDQDYTSTLLTPATYSGLLYEIFNVKCSDLDLDSDNTKLKKGQLDLGLIQPKVDKATDNKKNIKMNLDTNTDSIYSDIRYRHFSCVFPILSAKAKELNAEGIKISNIQLEEMKNLVSTKLQQVINTKRYLSNHILACETIVSSLGDKFEDIQIAERSLLYNRNRKSTYTYLDENLCTDANMFLSLKLMCLLTLTQGMSNDEYNSFITKYLQAFGHKYLYIFQNLVNAGLIIPPSSTKLQIGIPNLSTISEKLPRWQNNFQIMAKKLKQLPSENEDIVVKEPTCPSYVFSGSYIPFIAALSKILLSVENMNDFITKMQLLNDVKIGGPIIESLRSGIDELGEKLSKMQTDTSISDIDIACKDIKFLINHLKSDENKDFFPMKPRGLLIYVVGGLTQAEIAACHLVEKSTGGQILLTSDFIISGDNLLQAAM